MRNTNWAIVYANGIGVDKNEMIALVWYNRAADKAYGPALRKVDELMSGKKAESS